MKKSTFLNCTSTAGPDVCDIRRGLKKAPRKILRVDRLQTAPIHTGHLTDFNRINLLINQFVLVTSHLTPYSSILEAFS